MKRNLLFAAIMMAAFAFSGCAAGHYAQYRRLAPAQADSLKTMKVQDVIRLSQAGVSDSLIIGMMDATNSWFRLKTQDVLDLKNAGVSDNVISAMMQPPPNEQQHDSTAVRYYAYPPNLWYDASYPFGYYPAFSMGFGYFPTYRFGPLHRRFR